MPLLHHGRLPPRFFFKMELMLVVCAVVAFFTLLVFRLHWGLMNAQLPYGLGR